ncbi:MAG: TPM domain-containing protein [bacterium]
MRLIKAQLLILSLAMLFFALPAGAYSNPGKATGFVNDYAKVLKAEQKQALEQKLADFEKSTSNEISVVLIKSLDGDTIENYAVSLFKDWSIGKKGKDNGVLFLASIEDRKMRIEVGYGLEGALTDLQSSWILENQVKPNFKAGDYYAGINSAVDKIIGATQGEYVPATDKKALNMDSIFNLFGFLLFFLIPAFSAFAGWMAKSKSWWQGGIATGVIFLVVAVGYYIVIASFMMFLFVPVAMLFGFMLDYIFSRTILADHIKRNQALGHGFGTLSGGTGGQGGFGGFGGGHSGGGGSSSSW